MDGERYACVTFGLAGFHAEQEPRAGYGTCTLSGYDDPESFCEGFARRERESWPDGMPVVDLRKLAERDTWTVLNAPMFKPGLDPAEIEPFDMEQAKESMFAQTVLAQGGNAYGSILRLGLAHKGQEPGPLDYVGIEVFLDYYRRHGARIGVLRHDQDGAVNIVWES